jgi:AraC-like DNA-binding protein
MHSSPPAIQSFRFSTAVLTPRERGGALHNLRELGILPIEPLADLRPHMAIAKRILPGVAIMSGTLDGVRQGGTRFGGAAGDDVFFGVNLTGESTARQRGRELALRSGDAGFFMGAESDVCITRPTPVRFVGLRLPLTRLAPLVANPGDAGMRVVPREARPLQLLTRYLQALDMGASIDSLELGRTVAQHICDLIALSIGAHRDATTLLRQRGVRAARLRAIKADIAAHANDFELKVSAVALRHGVTPRYIQKLFEDDGVTFSEYVLGRRLDEAHLSLADPQLADQSISAIAFDAGFSDLSYFNRTYRRRFGTTPTETRMQAAAEAFNGAGTVVTATRKMR